MLWILTTNEMNNVKPFNFGLNFTQKIFEAEQQSSFDALFLIVVLSHAMLLSLLL